MTTLCRFFSVSRSAYYDWLDRSPTTLEKEDAELIEIIKDLFKIGRGNYGTRRLKKALMQKAEIVNVVVASTVKSYSGLCS